VRVNIRVGVLIISLPGEESLGNVMIRIKNNTNQISTVKSFSGWHLLQGSEFILIEAVSPDQKRPQ